MLSWLTFLPYTHARKGETTYSCQSSRRYAGRRFSQVLYWVGRELQLAFIFSAEFWLLLVQRDNLGIFPSMWELMLETLCRQQHHGLSSQKRLFLSLIVCAFYGNKDGQYKKNCLSVSHYCTGSLSPCHTATVTRETLTTYYSGCLDSYLPLHAISIIISNCCFPLWQ